MGGFGGLTPKPTVLMSNAPWIQELETPRRPSFAQVKTAKRYLDRDGRVRVTGTKFLKQTQSGPWLMLLLLLSFPKLPPQTFHLSADVNGWLCLRSYPRGFGTALAELVGRNLHPAARAMDYEEDGLDPIALFEWLQFAGENDTWEDAHLTEVVQYLWGNKHVYRHLLNSKD
jgi:hypothetical protein